MDAHICTACGLQYPPAPAPPDACILCEDDRQFVPETGQRWTTPQALRRTHRNSFHQYEPGLIGVGTTPAFGIGQRALIVRAPRGNVLWDCISLIDDATATLIEGLGGLAAIAISHPHFYTSMAEWSAAFGGVPVYIHADDREWAARPAAETVFWEGETRELMPGLTLIRCGGHFAGSAVLHRGPEAGGPDALLTGDTLQVTMDRRHVSFMRSFPNLVPLSAAAVARIAGAVEPYPFEAIYGGFWERVTRGGGKDVVRRSAQRYISAITGDGPADRER